jgi:hypothetical protein
MVLEMFVIRHEYSLFPTTPKQNLSFSAALKKSLFAVPVFCLIQKAVPLQA